MVEEQIQQVLFYIQEGSAYVWKENVLEDLETRKVEFESAGKFLLELKKEFGREDEESVKVAESRRLEQRGRIMKEFVQKFQRAAKDSRYEGRALVEEFKRRMNRTIRRKLMEVERPLTSIEQCYECATNPNKHWRKSRKKERLRRRRESKN